MVSQHIEQQILGRVHNNPDVPAIQALHNLLINIIRHRRWNTSSQHQRIIRPQPVKLGHQRIHRFPRNLRSPTVNLSPVDGFQLQVDAGDSLIQGNKLGFHAQLLHFLPNLLADKPGSKAKRRIGNSKVLKDRRNIDSLSARKQKLRIRPVSQSELKIAH